MNGQPTPTTVGEFLRASSAERLAQTEQLIADKKAAEAAVTVAAVATAAVDAAAAKGAAAIATDVAAQATTATKAAPKFLVYKADADAGVIYVVSTAAGIVDKDGDTMGRDDLVKAAHDFCASTERGFNANHGQGHYDLSNAQLVESIVGAPILKSGRVMALGEELPKASEDPVVGMNIEKGKETHALIGVRLNNADALAVAQKGGIIGASIEASCMKTEVTA